MAPNHHINPRFRAYGKARIDVTLRARDEGEWQRLWREPLNPFPFEFPGSWKFCTQYTVDDYAAEVGFFIDILGFPAIAFSPSYAQFTTPEEGFCISVTAAKPGQKSTDPETLRLQFMVEDIQETAKMLEQRGIVFEQQPAVTTSDAGMATGVFRTPHGVCVDLRGEVEPKPDIHSLMEEDDEDDADADRIIQQLLDQNAPEETDLEDSVQVDGLETPEDIVDKDHQQVVGSAVEDVEEDAPIQDTPPPKNDATPPLRSGNPHSPQPFKSNNQLHRPDRSETPRWSEGGHRGNGEVTYHEIEDDSGGLSEDAF